MRTSAVRYVFVYGTLRRGQVNDINRLQPAPVFLGTTRIQGVLFDLGAYPGLTLGGRTWVLGEVYAIEPALERQLDVIEAVAPTPSGEYQRREVVLHLNGRALPCLLYEINPAVVIGRPRVQGGDWVAARHQSLPSSHRPG